MQSRICKINTINTLTVFSYPSLSDSLKWTLVRVFPFYNVQMYSWYLLTHFCTEFQKNYSLFVLQLGLIATIYQKHQVNGLHIKKEVLRNTVIPPIGLSLTSKTWIYCKCEWDKAQIESQISHQFLNSNIWSGSDRSPINTNKRERLTDLLPVLPSSFQLNDMRQAKCLIFNMVSHVPMIYCLE